jgi:hypothetical protein
VPPQGFHEIGIVSSVEILESAAGIGQIQPNGDALRTSDGDGMRCVSDPIVMPLPDLLRRAVDSDHAALSDQGAQHVIGKISWIGTYRSQSHVTGDGDWLRLSGIDAFPIDSIGDVHVAIGQNLPVKCGTAGEQKESF